MFGECNARHIRCEWFKSFAVEEKQCWMQGRWKNKNILSKGILSRALTVC